jgi:hypothetical protein
MKRSTSRNTAEASRFSVAGLSCSCKPATTPTANFLDDDLFPAVGSVLATVNHRFEPLLTGISKKHRGIANGQFDPQL